MNRQPEVRARTRGKLIDAFFSQYGDASLRGVTVGGITGVAQVNRSTFYEYFQDVYDLVDQVEEELIGEVRAVASEAIGSGALTDAEALAEQGRALFERHGERLYILLTHADSGFAGRLVDAMGPVMKSALGLDTADPESELTVSFILSGIVGSLSSWYASGKRLPQDRMVVLVQRTMTAVLSASSGEDAVGNPHADASGTSHT